MAIDTSTFEMKKLQAFAIFLLLQVFSHANAVCYHDIKDKLPSGGTIIFGELHGTVELPALFLNCIQEFQQKKEAVQLFLEFPSTMDPILHRYIQGETSLPELLSEKHWQNSDGRASLAMLNLLNYFRDNNIRDIPVFAIDTAKYVENRDLEMKHNFIKNRSSTSYNFVLVGNVHAQILPNNHGARKFPSFASLVKDEIKELIILTAAYPSGHAWVCTPNCGQLALDGNDDDYQDFPAGSVSLINSEKHYSGIFRVETISASPPVKNTRTE